MKMVVVYIDVRTLSTEPQRPILEGVRHSFGRGGGRRGFEAASLCAADDGLRFLFTMIHIPLTKKKLLPYWSLFIHMLILHTLIIIQYGHQLPSKKLFRRTAVTSRGFWHEGRDCIPVQQKSKRKNENLIV